MIDVPRAPDALRPGGRALWGSVSPAHDLDAVQLTLLLEACRAKDRLDRLDEVLRTGVPYGVVSDYRLVVQRPLDLANVTGRAIGQLLRAMRLPDERGRRPQRRGARGYQAPSRPRRGDR